MRKLLVMALAIAAIVTGSAQASAGAVKIVEIYYDSTGADTGTNKSLNGEWVKIGNTGTTTKILTSWTLRDADKHVYTFPTFRLRPGHAVKIHTGKGKNTAWNLYWGSKKYIWDNSPNGDIATLRRKDGTRADRCDYRHQIGAATGC